jgi:shikimate kinase/3-dehydroquinate synthase
MGGGHLVLIGMPAVGKTSVGARLAAVLQLRHIDLDAELTRGSGMATGDLLRREGEAAFRLREAECLDQALAGEASVISVGGGAAAFHDGIERMRASGKVLWLDAPVEVLTERVLLDDTDRPLLGDTRQAVHENLTELLARRRPHYARAHVHVPAAQPLAQVVESARANAAEPEVVCDGAGGSYDHAVVLHEGGPAAAAEQVASLAGSAQVVLAVDRAVAAWAHPLRELLAARGLTVHWIELQGGERGKDLRGAAKLWSALAAAGVGRHDLLVAVGGGATTDLAGFCAATWQRGLRWVAIPTTVLSMADASVGGKTAIDLAEGKNLVGAFHPPQLAWLPLQALRTLSARQFRAGLAEVAKIFLLCDAVAWQTLLADAPALRRRSVAALRRHLAAAVRHKLRFVQEDPQERAGEGQVLGRALLNLGHTWGHAIEAESGYALLHGEAVALGLVAESEWSEAAGLSAAGTARQVREGLELLGFDTCWERGCTPSALARTQMDKKRRGQDMVLPALQQAGSARLVKVQWSLWQTTLAALAGAAAGRR